MFDIVEGVSWRLLEVMEIRDRLYYDYMLFYIYIKREREIRIVRILILD